MGLFRTFLRNVRPLQNIRRYRTMTAEDLLMVSVSKQTSPIMYISRHRSIFDALKRMIDKDVPGLFVVDDEKHVIGMLTQRDILKRIVVCGHDQWSGLVADIATPARDIVHVSPKDTLEDCRAIMALSGKSDLPVLQGSTLLGMISITDIATLIYKLESHGDSQSAKADYMKMIHPRRGIPKETCLLENRRRRYISEDRKMKYQLQSAAVSYPHPDKEIVGKEGEDSYFLGVMKEGQSNSTEGLVNYIGVADGVGSWFEQGVDPGKYSKILMEESHCAILANPSFPFVHPVDILNVAWHNIAQRAIVGSSTACIIALDSEQGELHAANLGDSGFLIIRDKNSDKRTVHMRGTLDGSLSRRIRDPECDLTPAGRRKGAHVSYRSPQQLHYFNCPYQIGYSENDSDGTHFDRPMDALLLRVPVLDGDLIILATDGLFDNLDEEMLLDVVSTESNVKILASKLALKARELSLDQSKDSPFSRLAKENDLLWRGGMPDDITVIASRVVSTTT